MARTLLNRKRNKIPFSNYTNKAIHKDLISIINKEKRILQEKENKQFGRRSQKISFVYASKILARRLKK